MPQQPSSKPRSWKWPLAMSLAIVCAAPLALRLVSAADAPKPTTLAATTRAATTKAASKPVVAKWQSGPFPADEVNLILFGDFGNGKPTQAQNAKTMAEYVAKTGTQFNGALTVGDNFYVKMRDVEDYQFQSVFEDVYDAKRLNFRFYASCGNHDWEKAGNGKTKMELELEWSAKHPDSRWTYPSRWHRVDFPQGAPEPLVTALLLESSMPRLTPAEWSSEKQWLEEQLASSKAKWKICCAHHPFFSNGSHGDNGIMQLEWGPIFKKYNVDFYIAGHDHDLQHLEIPGWPFSFVQCGGGGQGYTDMRRDSRGPFSRKLYGFAHLQIKGDTAEVKYVSAKDGAVVHDFTRDKKTGHVTVISTTGRDKASTKPLKTLLGITESATKPSTQPEKKPDVDNDGEDDPEEEKKLGPFK
jgi:hypothetical protein